MKIKFALVTLAAVCLFVLAFVFVVRPWYMRWGATDAEIAMRLPGDAFMQNPQAVSTRALTIHAPSQVVWKWLVQLGQGRGGFYSYYWLENLFASNMHNAERIVPAYQELQVGDWVLMHPLGATNALMRDEVLYIEPGRSLVLDGGWCLVLEPIDANTTRLLVRYPNNDDPIYYFSMFEQAHFIMESGMMLGLKQRAEASMRLDGATTKPAADGGKPYAAP